MGRRLDVSMVDTIFSILESGVVEYTVNGKMVGPSGNRDPSIAPFDSFPAKDGEFVMACGTDKFWKRLCEVKKSHPGRKGLRADQIGRASCRERV